MHEEKYEIEEGELHRKISKIHFIIYQKQNDKEVKDEIYLI